MAVMGERVVKEDLSKMMTFEQITVKRERQLFQDIWGVAGAECVQGGQGARDKNMR